MSSEQAKPVSSAETAVPGNGISLERRFVFLHGNVIAEVFQGYDEHDNGMGNAPEHAALLADAFNVLHETGMTPRELLDSRQKLSGEVSNREHDIFVLAKQRDELLAALVNLVTAVETTDRDSLMELIAAHKAITSAKGGAV